jgi:hypothetical protein
METKDLVDSERYFGSFSAAKGKGDNTNFARSKDNKEK